MKSIEKIEYNPNKIKSCGISAYGGSEKLGKVDIRQNNEEEKKQKRNAIGFRREQERIEDNGSNDSKVIKGFKEGNEKAKVAERMLIEVNRGEDERTVVCTDNGKFCVGQNRLAIVDVENQDTLSMMKYNEKGRDIVLTFNGEIYNFRELRAELEKIGYSFKTSSDTEVLLKTIVEYGKEALNKLNGQFAFVFADGATGEMLLARDKTGKKPLYYSHPENSELMAASVPSALIKEIGFKHNIKAIASAVTIGSVLAGADEPDGESFYEGISQLKRGELLIYNAGNKEIKKEIYASPSIEDEPEIKPEEEKELRKDLIFQFSSIFEDAIRKRVPDEVQTGVALSGGIDSSMVATVAADHLKTHNTEFKELIAACIYYTKQKNNEDYRHARMLADNMDNIKLIKTEISPANFLDNLEDMVSVLGPHDSIRQLAMFANYKNLKKHGVKVALIGEGADEFNWGYLSFPGMGEEAKEECSTREGFKKLILKRKEYAEQLLSEEAREEVDFDKIADYLLDVYDSFETSDPTRKMMGVYTTEFLGFLNKANDRLSMYNLVESRAGFQDKDLIEFCKRIPKKFQIKEIIDEHGNTRQEGKQIQREAFRGKYGIPDEIIDRKKEALPAASHLDYHKKIAEEFRKRISSIDEDFWENYDKNNWHKLADSYKKRIEALENEFEDPEMAGAKLMEWRKVSEDADIINGKGIRTNDVFKPLTILVDYQLKSKYKK